MQQQLAQHRGTTQLHKPGAAAQALVSSSGKVHLHVLVELVDVAVGWGQALVRLAVQVGNPGLLALVGSGSAGPLCTLSLGLPAGGAGPGLGWWLQGNNCLRGACLRVAAVAELKCADARGISLCRSSVGKCLSLC